jgi:hypothetical protein
VVLLATTAAFSGLPGGLIESGLHVHATDQLGIGGQVPTDGMAGVLAVSEDAKRTLRYPTGHDLAATHWCRVPSFAIPFWLRTSFDDDEIRRIAVRAVVIVAGLPGPLSSCYSRTYLLVCRFRHLLFHPVLPD